MRTTTDSLGVGYLREAKMRLSNKSHLSNTGLTTIPKKCLITNLLESFFKMTNLDLKFTDNLLKSDFFTIFNKLLCKYAFLRII